MKLPEPFLTVAIAALGMFDVVLFVMLRGLDLFRHSHPIADLALNGFVFAQVALLGIWLALGRRDLWARVVLLLLVSFFLGWFGIRFGRGVDPHSAMIWFGITEMFIAVPLWVLRWMGFRLFNPFFDVEDDYPRLPKRVGQFSLLQVIVLTTLLAMLFAFSRWQGVVTFADLRAWIRPISIFAIAAMCWAVLRPEPPRWLRLVLIGVVPGAIGVLVVGVVLLPDAATGRMVIWPYVIEFLLFCYITTALTVLGLLACRQSGYRLIRLPLADEAEQGNGSRRLDA